MVNRNSKYGSLLQPVFTRITRNNRNAIKRRVGTATTVRLPVIIAGMFAIAGTTESALGCYRKDAFEP